MTRNPNSDAAREGEGEFSLEFFRVGEDSTLWLRSQWGDRTPVEYNFKFPLLRKLSGPLTLEEAEKRGRLLFQALFPRPIANELAAARERTPALRIRLAIPPELEGRHRLERISWESALDPFSGEFLGLSRNLKLVRDIGRPVEALTELSGPARLRVLVVAASPKDRHPVSWEEEVQAIKETLGNRGEVLELANSSFRDFGARLQAQPKEDRIHVVHFIGHAGIGKKSQALAAFEKPDGTSEFVTADQLASQLEGIPELRLVVLAACKTAAPTVSWDHDPSRSIAYALLTRGVPAVVGTRINFGDAAGPVFAKGFYRSLIKGNDLETAATQARRKVSLDRKVKGGYEEWSTPILYSQVRNSRLFRFARQNDHGPHRLAITSGNWSWASGLTYPHLDLAKNFAGKQLAPGRTWPDLYSRIGNFLRHRIFLSCDTELRLDVFLSLAFATGYRVGTTWPRLTILQRQPHSGEDRFQVSKRPDAGRYLSWNFEASGDSSAADLLVAISITHPVAGQVDRAWKSLDGRPVRILAASLEPGHGAIEGADHAWVLAEQLTASISELGPSGRIHLFLAGTASFAFYLGQLAGQLGEIQLYHHDAEQTPPYSPSILVRPADRLPASN